MVILIGMIAGLPEKSFQGYNQAMARQNPILIRNEQEEYDQIRKDLRFVIIMNSIFFALLIGLYFLNRSTGKIDSFFAHFLKF